MVVASVVCCERLWRLFVLINMSQVNIRARARECVCVRERFESGAFG